MDDLIKAHTLKVLQRVGEIGKAAKSLGISRRTLSTWIRKWGLEKTWKLPGTDAGPSAAI